VRSYDVGFYTVDDLYHAFRNNGYNDRDARELVDFHKTQRLRMIANSTGVLTMRKIVGYYRDGPMSYSDAFEAMRGIMPDPEVRDDLLKRVDLEQAADIRRCNLKRLKKKYMYGYYSRLEAIAAISQYVSDKPKILLLVDEWECERESRVKEPRIAQLCQWYVQGFITGDEYLRRLINLGYTPEDAYRMVGVCFNTEMLKRLKARAAATRQNIKDYQQQQRQEKQDLKSAIADAQKQLKDLLAQIDKQSHTKEQLKNVEHLPDGSTLTTTTTSG
jgi:hypothetical protein